MDAYVEDDDVDNLLADDLAHKGRLVASDTHSSITEDSYPVSRDKPPKGHAGYLANFQLAWDSLIAEGSNEVLFDDGVVELASDVLTTLTNHGFRPMRHTAVAGALRLLTALLKQASIYSEHIETTTSMFEAEQATLTHLQSSGRGSKDSKVTQLAIKQAKEKVDQLQAQVQSATMMRDNCKDAASALYSSVLAHRYRDTAPAIRVDVLDCLETMLTQYPAEYLNNSHLKYAGWLLHDKDPVVRTRALKVIINLFTLPSTYLALTKEFLNRFRPHILAMTRDTDGKAAREAIKLLRCALAAGLEEDDDTRRADIAVVQASILSADAGVRQEAGALLSEHLDPFKQAQDNEAEEGDDAGDTTMDNDEDMDAGVGAGAGKAGKGGGKGKKAPVDKAKQAAARAAARAAKAQRLAREQLQALVQVGTSQLPEPKGEDEEQQQHLQSPSPAASGVMAFVASSFWSHPAGARALTNWEAHRSYLLGSNASAAGKAAGGFDDDSGATQAVNGSADNEGNDELPDVEARLALRLLREAVWRSCGHSDLDGSIGVPTRESAAGGAGGSGYGSGYGAGSGAGAATGDAGKEAEGSAPFLSASKDAIERSRDGMSAAVAAMLPDLLARYGGDAENAWTLASITQAVHLSTYSLARNQKVFGTTLYQLSRLYSQHTSPACLTALASALRHMASEDHKGSRDAAASLQKLVSQLAGTATRMAAHITGNGGDAGAGAASSSSAASKSKKKGKKGGSKSAQMELDGDDVNADDQEQSIASARPVGMAAVLRRLRILVSALADTDVTFPETGDVSGGLMTSVSTVLRKRCNLLTLFDACNSSIDGIDAAEYETCLESLCPALPREGLRLLQDITAAAVRRATTLAKSLFDAAVDAEKDEAEVAAHKAKQLRDLTLSCTMPFLALRHPHMVGDDEPQQTNEDTESGLTASVKTIVASYTLPPTASPPERAYILRCRHAAFTTLCTIGGLCSADTLKSSYAADLAWSPSDDDNTMIASYVNQAMGYGPRELQAMGIDLPLAHARGSGDDGGGDSGGVDEAELEMHEEDTQMNSAMQSMGGMAGDEEEEGGMDNGDTSAAAVSAKEDMKRGQVETRDMAARVAKAIHILRPLALLSMALPSGERLGHTVGRRILEDDSEAGRLGSELVKYHVHKTKERDVNALLAMQLRSTLDSASGLVKMRQRLAAAADDETASAMREQLELVVSEVLRLVKRQAQNIGVAANSVHKTIRGPLMNMLLNGVKKALAGAPDRCAVLGLLSVYLSLLRPADHELLADRFTKAISTGEYALTDDQQSVFEAAMQLYKQRIKLGSAVPATYKGRSIADLQPWIPMAAFLDLLSSGAAGSAKVALVSLRCCVGLVGAAPAGAVAAAGAGAGSSNKAGKPQQQQQAMEEQEEQPMQQDDEDIGQAAAAEQLDEEEEEDQDDDDDDEDYGRGGKAKARGKGKAASKTPNTAKKQPAARRSSGAAGDGEERGSGTTGSRAGSRLSQIVGRPVSDVMLSQSTSSQYSRAGRFGASLEDDDE